MNLRRRWSRLFGPVLLGVLAAAIAWGFATPSITQVTAFSPLGGNIPAVTTGIANPFISLDIAGNFNPDAVLKVTWFNPVTNVSVDFTSGTGISNLSTGDISVDVPNALFGTPVTAPQAVQITVTEAATPGGGGVSNAATFTLNPPLTTLGPALPGATLGQPYNAQYLQGGTSPFFAIGSPNFPLDIEPATDPRFLAGVCSSPGFHAFQPGVTDAWNTAQTPQLGLQCVSQASINSPLNPNTAVVGPSPITVSATGTNFFPAGMVGSTVIPGTQIVWTNGSFHANLTTTVTNANSLSFVIPATLLGSPASVNITAVQPDGEISTSVAFFVVARLHINTTGLPPGQSGVPYSTQVQVVGGVLPYSFSASGLPPGISISNLNGIISGTTSAAGNYSVTVIVKDSAGQTETGIWTLQITSSVPPLQITTPLLPNGTTGALYGAAVSATGGSPGYVFSLTAGSLPAGLTLFSNGAISGTPATAGTSRFTVQVTDSANGHASQDYSITILPPAPAPLQITPPSLPNGQVSVPYGAAVAATGGSPGYVFSLTGGSLPPGLTFSSNGAISGTPTTAGTSGFTVQVTDTASGKSSQDYSITILPPPLTVTGTVADTTVGSPISITFGGAGGFPPYRIGVSGAIPSGTTFTNGVLSGTPNSPGSFVFTVSVTDSQNNNATKTFTINVGLPTLAIAGSFTDGQVGVAYSSSVSGTGGSLPYTFSATGVPPGLTFSPAGLLSGTPTADGSFTVAVTLADSAKGVVNKSFTITIAPATLAIDTASLPDGTVGAAYTASVTASGGVKPYTFTIGGLPAGLTATAGGAISGTPGANGTSNVTVSVTDAKGAKANKTLSLTIQPATLAITTTSLPGGTVGTAYTASVAATGGVSPYTFSATGLPAGVSLSAGGAFSGTPTAPGTSNVTVTVKDSLGATASKPLSIAVVLPPSPPVTFTGLPATSNPATQPRVTIELGAPYPVPVTVTLTLTFAADTGPDDPAVQFQTGGRTATVTIPTGSTTAPDIGIQTGTVAGTITITTRLTASSQDITPSPVPTRTIRITAIPPVIQTATATRSGSGITLVITGYASSREMTQLVAQFSVSAGATLQTGTITVPLDTLFAQWYASAASLPFGSQFTLTQPFNVSGNVQQVTSVTVTLTNKVGSSAATTVNVQ